MELRPRVDQTQGWGTDVHLLCGRASSSCVHGAARSSGGVKKDEGLVVWDPLCGTGMELIETSLLCGNVRALVGTDIDESATSIAERTSTRRSICGDRLHDDHLSERGLS